MLPNQSAVSVKDTARKAIDSFGILGSFYDGHRDQIVKPNYVNSEIQLSELLESPSCTINKGSVDGRLNILRFIGIQDDLRLNLLLNITKRVGITSILNYSRRINEYTRFLYYSWVTRKEQTTITVEQVQQSTQFSNSNFNATHIITAIDFGIEFVAVLQLPYEGNIIRQIDDILHKIRHRLMNDNDSTLILTSEDELALEKLINITTYSNISSLMTITRVSDIFYEIDRMKTNVNYCHPLTYYLQPIERFNLPHLSNNIAFRLLSRELREQLEQYILQFRTPIKYLEASLNQHIPKYSYEHLQNRIYNARRQYLTLNDIYMKKISRLTELRIAVSSGRSDASIISQELNPNEQINILKTSIAQLIKDISDLENEIKFATHSRKQQRNYFQTSEQHLHENDTTIIIDPLAKMDVPRDELLNTKSASNIPSEYDAGSHYTFSPLQDTIIFSPNNTDDKKNEIKQRMPSTTIASKNSVKQKQSLPVSNEIINILLLGETGVGKSTFINAFVNYLNFERLDQAQSNKAAVLIPGSFVMTIGDKSEERTVQFGNFNDSNNEDFNHPGQSVTQHCKTYIFHLNDGSKLCLIDTPGFGDTRGIDQDDLTMQHILEYINNLTHINAICFLLKPNVSRLNIFFRSCFTQLFDFLGPNISKNFIFCFTNARSTFYNPGDTAPLLKSMLESLPMKDIPFKKDNTFCFDSESFRYLIALQDGIAFSDDDKFEYEISWSTSVNESNRLIDYIRSKLTAHSLQNGWQSIKHAQFQILHIIRPMLETIRNTLRNITLWNIESPNQSIDLCSTVIQRPVFLCFTCIPKIIKAGNFGIIPDSLHEIHKTCRTCQCPSNKHSQIEYVLNYRLMNRPSKNSISEMKDQLLILRDASAEFAYFLQNVACCTKENQILVQLTRMIEQETNICRRLRPNYLNLQLVKELTQWKQKYQERINEITLKKDHNDLTVIYKWIDKMKELPIMIKEQLSVIKKGHEIMMKQHELQPRQI